MRALARELAAAGALGVDLVVVHAGSHGGDGEEKGMDRLVDGLGRARERAARTRRSSGPWPNLWSRTLSGAGTQLCSTFDALGEVARRAGVRVCVDTAHAFVAGYDLSARERRARGRGGARGRPGRRGRAGSPQRREERTGSHRDGHRKVGEGRIPVDAWPGFFDGLPGVPVVMETPYETPEADAEEVLLVKKLAGGLRKAPRWKIESRA